jgi:hypothetical protein
MIKQFTFETWSDNQVTLAVTYYWFNQMELLAEAAHATIAYSFANEINSYGSRKFLEESFNMHKGTGVVLVSIVCDLDVPELVEHKTKALDVLPEEIPAEMGW